MKTKRHNSVRITTKTNNIIARDKKFFFTTTRQPYPLVVEKGDGDFIYDVEGNSFIDFASFISAYNLGVNANKQIRDAAKAQIDKIMHAAFSEYYAELPVKFAEELMPLFPKGFGRTFLSNSGTEANEAAIKVAKIATKRPYLLAFYNAFHGRTMGSLGLTASKGVHRNHFGPFNNTLHAPFPNPYRCPFNSSSEEECSTQCIDYLKKFTAKKDASAEEIAAIFIEPIQGEGGYVVPPKEFVKQLREFATDNGILLVSDEVQTGYMRTGKFLAMDNFGIKADIYTMAKSLGGGMPLGATIAKLSLGDLPYAAHGTTFGGNLVSVAAAYASIKYVKKHMRELEQQIAAKSKYALSRLNEMKQQYEIIGDIRGIGLMIGVELVTNRTTKSPAVKQTEALLKQAFHNGLVLLPAGESTIRIIPPVTISQSSLEDGLDIFERVIKSTNATI